MKIGYNTNGFGFHDFDQALEIIAELGYSCVAITLDVHHFNPFKVDSHEIQKLRKRLEELGLYVVIETGARFLLDARRKHYPTLLDSDNQRRWDFLERSMHIASELGALCVSYWSGKVSEEEAHRVSREQLFLRLAEAVKKLEGRADTLGVQLAFEPEPGFLIESMADYDQLCALVGKRIGLTLDVGHLQCVERIPPEHFIRRYADVLVNLQLDDMVQGVHQHLMFGEGEIAYGPLFQALKEIDYQGPACVELSDASRNAVQVARQAFDFLRASFEEKS